MTEFKETELDERAINMAKVLSADAVEKAGSGHPGSPVSLAPVAYTLYQHFIKHDPNDPNWEGRDRFILSGGHASLTQYVQLYFSGYGVTLDDLKHFRGGADTRTPGHPEYGLTPGIEMTTGPLGQGFASAIGFAYGERFQRGLLDPETPKEESPFYHKIWAICGEGDIEEGISGEAAALAANQKLGNITVIFDANRIQIEGDTNLVLAVFLLAVGVAALDLRVIQPFRTPPCNPETLEEGHVCLSQVLKEWPGKILWIDARKQDDFERHTVTRAPVYPIRPADANYQELLANAMEALMTAEDKGFCIVIFCSRDCTSSAAVANELKKPEYGIRAPIFILEGGWDELRKEPSLVP